MSAERVFVGLGSNLGDPQARVAEALALLEREAGIELLARSRPYRTSPWGRLEQPAFVNAVAEIRSAHRPGGLLQLLKQIESQLGRCRELEERWGPRVIDLDLLAYGERRLNEAGLEIPHPRLAERRFVLEPWAEIAPDFQVPELGTVAALLRRCRDSGTVGPLGAPDAGPGQEHGRGRR